MVEKNWYLVGFETEINAIDMSFAYNLNELFRNVQLLVALLELRVIIVRNEAW